MFTKFITLNLAIYGRFSKCHRVFLGRDPGTLKSDIVSKKTSTIKLFGFETLKLKIRRLKLWKPTVRTRLRQAGIWGAYLHGVLSDAERAMRTERPT